MSGFLSRIGACCFFVVLSAACWTFLCTDFVPPENMKAFRLCRSLPSARAFFLAFFPVFFTGRRLAAEEPAGAAPAASIVDSGEETDSTNDLC